MLNLLAITLLAVIVKNPSMIQNLENDDDSLLPTPVTFTKVENVDSPYYYRDHSMNYQEMDMGGLVCLCMIAITLMLIYGTLKGNLLNV
jgi:lysosomal-associated transmembrane protein